MTKRKSRLDLHVEKTEKFVNYILKRKHDSIQKSLIRPLYQEALKSLFFVIIMLLDTFIPLQILLSLPNTINIIFALITLVIFLYVEMWIYNLLWGKNGRWSLDKYKKISEENKQNSN